MTLMDCLKDRLCILKYSWIFKIVGVKDMAITFFCMVSKEGVVPFVVRYKT